MILTIRRAFALAAIFAIAAPVFAQAKAQKGYEPPRLTDGKPDLNGAWEVGAKDARAKVDSDLEGKIGGKKIIVDPPDGKIPYKPEALAQRKENAAKRPAADPMSKCFMPGVPRLAYVPYPFQIVESANQPIISFLSQYAHTVRNIFMKGEHLEGLDMWLGDSRGHWEGDTLVVEVTNINDMTWLDASGNYHSDALRVMEHFTRTGPETITYEATLEDPKVFTRPMKISMPLTLHTEKNFQIMEHECYAVKEGPTLTVGDKPDPQHGR